MINIPAENTKKIYIDDGFIMIKEASFKKEINLIYSPSIIISQSTIQVGCMDIEPGVLELLLQEWKNKFGVIGNIYTIQKHKDFIPTL